MDQEKLEIECVILAQEFETYWAYYLMSSGQLFEDSTRKSARLFLAVYDELVNLDDTYRYPSILIAWDDAEIDRTVAKLREWAGSSIPWPWEQPFKSRLPLWTFISGIKVIVAKHLRITRGPHVAISFLELEHSEAYARWGGHLPRVALRENPDALIEQASLSETIVVIGDIRKSQDLMTYALSASEFSSRMVEFITQTRNNLASHAGFFDKFTGDGFLAYFNETVCAQAGKDHTESFLYFVRDEMAFAHEHFAHWTANIRKLPAARVGLALGADVGVVTFNYTQRHLVAVGDSIVWASRMASAANAGEVLLNNLLWHKLAGHPDLSVEDRQATTKNGESFLAKALTTADLSHSTRHSPEHSASGAGPGPDG